MISIAAFWAEFNKPIEYLEDPLARFISDARLLINICLIRELPFQVPEAGLSEAFSRSGYSRRCIRKWSSCRRNE
jgi:hypothetical protein